MGSSVDAVLRKRVQTVAGSITRPANVTAYTAADAISDVTADALFTFTGIDVARGFLTLDSLRIDSSNAGADGNLGLWLFIADPGTTADNAAFAPTSAELLHLVDVVDIPAANWQASANFAVAFVRDINMTFRSGTSLWAQLVATGAYTPISGEVINLRLSLA